MCIRDRIHPDKVQPEEIGHDELSMEVKVDGEMKHLSLIHIYNLAKVRLIPNDISRRHLKEIKDLSVMDGDASD